HDRRLLTLDPAQDRAGVEHEHDGERHAPEDDAEIQDHACALARWPGGVGTPVEVAPAIIWPWSPMDWYVRLAKAGTARASSRNQWSARLPAGVPPMAVSTRPSRSHAGSA